MYYGRDADDMNATVRISRNPLHILGPETTTLSRADCSESGHISFDYVSAISSFLCDSVNKNLPSDSFDEHGRLNRGRSFQGLNGFAEIPIVNTYVENLRDEIRSRTGKPWVPLWPPGRKCAIVLTHDVDQPDKYAGIYAPFLCTRLGLRRNITNNLNRLKLARMRILDSNPGDYWQFSEIMNYEGKHGLRSTFLFATVNRYSELGTDTDVSYDIRRKEYRDILDDMGQRGVEVGLHASYMAYANPNRLLLERRELSRLSGQIIWGLRHHYWHLGPDVERTQRYHEESGLEYDLSLGFNDNIGFRRSVALPFHPWDSVHLRPINVLQIPTFCMDGNLFYQETTVDEAVTRLKSIISTIKHLGGVGAIDWHVRTSYPGNTEYENWGKAYLRILDWLATDEEIWTTCASEVNAWVRKRQGMLRSEEVHSSKGRTQAGC